jgi:hypothetical protein
LSEKAKSVVLPSDTQVQAEKYETFIPQIAGDLAIATLSNPPDRTKPASGGSYYRTETFADIENRREKVNGLLKKYEED